MSFQGLLRALTILDTFYRYLYRYPEYMIIETLLK